MLCLCLDKWEYMRKLLGYSHEEMEATLAPARAVSARLRRILDERHQTAPPDLTG